MIPRSTVFTTRILQLRPYGSAALVIPNRATKRSISRVSVSNDASYALGHGRINTSIGAITGSMRVRTNSRSRRLSRFRSTMVRLYFGTMIPTRANANGEATIRTSKCPVLIRFPVRLIASMSVAREIRCARENVLRAGVLRRQLNRQPLAPLLPATCQHFASPPSRHPLAETMRLDPALVPRPIRGLTHNSPSAKTIYVHDLRAFQNSR